MVHRWTRGADLVALLWILRQMLDAAGSLEAFFARGLRADAADVGAALDAFSTRAWRSTSGALTAACRARLACAISFRVPRRAARASG